jgi:methylmalonyl-CoA mutase cobalamin-binding subunit
LVRSDRNIITHKRSVPLGSGDLSPELLIEEALEAADASDAEKLETILYRSATAFSRPVLIEQFLVNFLIRIGERWQDGSLRIAQEHFTSSLIQKFLLGLCRNTEYSESDPRALAATLSGTHHEFGVLMAGATAVDCGWQVLYFGPNLTEEEIAGAAIAKRVQGVLLSIVYPPGDPAIAGKLQMLRKCLPAEISIIVGGRSAESYKEVLDSIAAALVPDLNALRRYLSS